MQTVLYNGSFEGLLCAVFDVYDYRLEGVNIEKETAYSGNIFEKVHKVNFDTAHSDRVWKGLQKKLSKEALQQLYQAFLSELPGMENTLLQYIQYVFSSTENIETDFGHPAVLTVYQAAKKVHREKHRMEAFVRFQQTADDLFFAIIEPDYNVLSLTQEHFQKRYADQRWTIWDGKRQYGLYYDGDTVSSVHWTFTDGTNAGRDIAALYTESEEKYQQLWQQYFKSVNIPARKNTRLHLQHMPARYWKFLPEKRGL